VTDSSGKRLRYIRAPGDIHLSFSHITVQRPLPNLSGEISAKLQVPIFSGPGDLLRFDLPYTVIPQQSSNGASCDDYSGVVSHGDKQYCRYCQLCATNEAIVGQLRNSTHKYDDTDSSTVEKFNDVCEKVSATEYSVTRKISLPGRKELEAQAEQKFGHIDQATKDRLRQGAGRFQVFLNLISSPSGTMSQTDFYAQSRECRCCGDDTKNDVSCQLLQRLACNKDVCNTKYANVCLPTDATIVGCLAVEFTYKLTYDYNDVRAQLTKLGLLDEVEGTNNDNNQQTTSTTDTPSTEDPDQIKDECVSKIPAEVSHVINYCKTFWSPKVCCPHCEGVCDGK